MMDTNCTPDTNSSISISSEFNEYLQRVVNIIIDVTSGITLLTSLFIIYLIFYQSPKAMSVYKKYLLANVILEILSVMTLSLGKPRILYTANIVFTSGILPFQQGTATILIYIIWHDMMVLSATCLLLIHIERYYTLHEGLGQNSSCLNPKFFVYFYIMLTIIMTLGIGIPGIYGDVFIMGPSVLTDLAKISGGRDFLVKFPGAILLNNKRTVWVLVYYISLIVAGSLILIPLFIFLSLNVFTGFKSVHSNRFSQKTKNIHITLLKTSIFQVITLFIFGTIPVILFIIALMVGRTLIGMDYLQCVLNIYPLFDNIVVLLVIKPYRDFILNCWRKDAVKEYNGNA